MEFVTSKRAVNCFSLSFCLFIFNFIFFLIYVKYSNPGRFGKRNRPGYPIPMKLVGKFASSANARVPVNFMSDLIVNQPEDILPISLLCDYIVSAYEPGDVVLVAFSHPTNFCIDYLSMVRKKNYYF